MEYTAYVIGPDGHRQKPELLLCESDALAVDQVRQMLLGLGLPIELWQGKRMVGWFQETNSGIAGVLSTTSFDPASCVAPSSDTVAKVQP